MTHRKLLHVDYRADEKRPMLCLSVYDPNQKIINRPHFYIFVDAMETLRTTGFLYDKDIRSYLTASIESGNRLRLEFTWIEHEDYRGSISGRIETVYVSWTDMQLILMTDNSEDKHYAMLDIGHDTTKPKITFMRTENLQRALKDPLLRRKVAKAFMQNFNYPGADEIRIYNDYEPHSFYFEEIRNGKTAMSGGLILHNRDNPRKMQYSIHT